MAFLNAKNITIAATLVVGGVGAVLYQNPKIMCSINPYCYKIDDIKCNTEKVSICTDKNDKLLNGEVQQYYKDGQLAAKISFKDGKNHGKIYMYHPNGQVAKLITFEEGTPNGAFADYYSTGQLQKQGTYTNGEILGTVTTYYESGKLKSETNITEIETVDNRKLMSSSEKEYYEDGTLKMNKILTKGNGTIDKYHPNSIILTHGEYKNGLPNGEFREYYNDGKLRILYTMQDGKVEGKSTHYFEDGQTIFMTISNKGGKRHGEVKAYSRDGKLKEIAEFENGNYIHHTFVSKSKETKILKK